MQIVIVSKSDLNECWSAIQYTNNCHLCDKIFSCKVKSPFHIEGLKRIEETEIDKIIKENMVRLDKVKENVKQKLKSLNFKPF